MLAQAFNFLIGGVRSHAKSYSIICEPGGAFGLMPLYERFQIFVDTFYYCAGLAVDKAGARGQCS